MGILAGTRTEGNKSISNWEWHYVAGLGRMAIMWIVFWLTHSPML